MSKLALRSAGVLALSVGWLSACGGSAFNAGGAAGSSGSSTTGGGSSAGDGSGGSSGSSGSSQGGSSGAAQAGAPQGGGAQGGVSSGGAPGTAGASTAGAGGATLRNSGDCDVAKDCAAGGKCVALSVDGFRTCVLPVPVTTTCGSATDQCCVDSKQCSGGASCVVAPLAPSCGLVSVAGNVCATSQCMVDSDCAGNNSICVPAGALDRKANTCLTGGCRRDTDCKDAAGGKCEPVTPACCGGVTGLYCVYPGTGCRSGADCAAGSSCTIVNQKSGQCVTGGIACAE